MSQENAIHGKPWEAALNLMQRGQDEASVAQRGKNLLLQYAETRLQNVNMLLELLYQKDGKELKLPASESAVEMLSLRASVIDGEISESLNAIMHDPQFQGLEATWRGLHYLVSNTETSERLKLRVLNASFAELKSDLDKAVEFDQSSLFKKLYEEEYGTFGGEPYSCLLHAHEYGRSPTDLAMLEHLSKVAAAAHTPLLSAASPAMFDMDSFLDLGNPRDLSKTFQTAECIQWRAFREQEDARYVNLCLPRMLLRLPYDKDNTVVQEFAFDERVDGSTHSNYLWGNAAFALARCITSAFALHGWTAAIRGYEGGGVVEGLPIHTFERPSGEKVAKLPTEIGITDRREKELSELGFISLIYRKGSNQAAFFGGQSVHRAPEYDLEDATANSRISARLPYLLNASRFAHYIKALMRDKVGSFTSAESIGQYLNSWITRFVLLSDTAGQEIKARYPLREARIDVVEDPSDPGEYQAIIYLRPHFQFEGMTASIRLVAKLPPPLAAPAEE